MITCGQPESFCLSEKYLRSLEAPVVQNSTWRGKNNASLYLSSLNIYIYIYIYIGLVPKRSCPEMTCIRKFES